VGVVDSLVREVVAEARQGVLDRVDQLAEESRGDDGAGAERLESLRAALLQELSGTRSAVEVQGGAMRQAVTDARNAADAHSTSFRQELADVRSAVEAEGGSVRH
jgi:hypothetical protein